MTFYLSQAEMDRWTFAVRQYVPGTLPPVLWEFLDRRPGDEVLALGGGVFALEVVGDDDPRRGTFGQISTEDRI